MSDSPASDLGAIRRRLEAIGVTGDWWLHDMALTRSDIAAFLAAYDAQAQARDDFTTSTYEMLGELLAAHQITPDPCPGGQCVANALLAIGHALTAAEAERDQARADAADAMLAHGLAVEALRHVEAECKRDLAACEGHRRQRAALETAARAWHATRGVSNPTTRRAADQALEEAVANLPAPPEEGA